MAYRCLSVPCLSVSDQYVCLYMTDYSPRVCVHLCVCLNVTHASTEVSVFTDEKLSARLPLSPALPPPYSWIRPSLLDISVTSVIDHKLSFHTHE